MDPATIAAILTALGIGGLVGAWANAWHERTAKFRDLTIDACVTYLERNDVAQGELRAAQFALLGDEGGGTRNDSLKQLVRGRDAWRDLQTQAFRLSLVLRGGGGASAARDAASVVVLYSRWLDSLGDLAEGRVSPSATRAIAIAYSGAANEFHQRFARHANEAIRPRVVKARRGHGGSGSHKQFDELLADLDAYSEAQRVASSDKEIGLVGAVQESESLKGA